MNIENLYKIRNILLTESGKLLITFMDDYITENACKSRDANEIKGMCELLHKVKNIPALAEKLNK